MKAARRVRRRASGNGPFEAPRPAPILRPILQKGRIGFRRKSYADMVILNTKDTTHKGVVRRAETERHAMHALRNRHERRRAGGDGGDAIRQVYCRQGEGARLVWWERVGLGPECAVVGFHNHVVARTAPDVGAVERDFAEGRIEDVFGQREAGRATPERAHDLHTFLNRRAERGGAADELGLVEIIRPHAHPHEALAERLHCLHVVIDAAQQHGLVAHRHTGLQKPVDGLSGVGGEFVGVVEVGVDPEGMIATEEVAQGVVDAVRQLHRHPRAEPDDLNVRNRTQAAQQPVQVFFIKGERVAAGQEHVADLGVGSEVVEGVLEFAFFHEERRVADHAFAKAVAAVDGALRRHTKRHAVAVVVDQVFDGRVRLFLQRIGHADDVGRHLAHPRDDLPPDRAVGVVRVHQRGIVWGDIPPKYIFGRLDSR